MTWTKDRIITELQSLHETGEDLSYNRLAKSNQSLVSAAAYHFGSYRGAVEQAEIAYAEVTRRPRWTKENVITSIRQASKKGQDLNWSAVTKRGDELGRAAFAAIQPRLFGRWDKALAAAGLDAGEISPYRSWNKPAITAALSARSAAGSAMNSGAVQKQDPSLHAAAVRYFAGYEHALRAAKIDPDTARTRRRWSAETVRKELRKLKRDGVHLSDPTVRKHHAALYGAAVRLFGTFTAAREAAGIVLKADKSE